MKIFTMVCLLILSGCTMASQTNNLYPGMTRNQVAATMGQPDSSQFLANHMVWKYGVFQPGKGSVPYYLVFDEKGEQLQRWFADEEEYQRNQLLWLQAFPPTKNENINLRITDDD